jgi:hypothetical protein
LPQEVNVIEPTVKDIGRRVVYTDPGSKDQEIGTIVRFTKHFVFVRYGNFGSKATLRNNLEWLYPEGRK